MSVSYAKALPIDERGGLMHNSPPAFPALATTVRENGSVSSVTSLNADTTVVEVTAVGGGAGIKWTNSQATSVVTAASGASFDNFVAAGTTRLLVVPRSSQAVASIVGKNVQEGLYSAIAIKTNPVGSVLLTEY